MPRFEFCGVVGFSVWFALACSALDLVVSVFSGFGFMILVICGLWAVSGVWDCVRQSFAILGGCGSFGVGLFGISWF